MSVGVGLGLLFLMREGISLATLRMGAEESGRREEDAVAEELHARTGVSG
jgi:hypothetical protein